jgi:hypothetical protein
MLLRDENFDISDNEEAEIVKNIDQMLLRDKRYELNNEEEFGVNDIVPYNFPKTKEEKIETAKTKRKISMEIEDIGKTMEERIINKLRVERKEN